MLQVELQLAVHSESIPVSLNKASIPKASSAIACHSPTWIIRPSNSVALLLVVVVWLPWSFTMSCWDVVVLFGSISHRCIVFATSLCLVLWFVVCLTFFRVSFVITLQDCYDPGVRDCWNDVSWCWEECSLHELKKQAN